MQWIIRFFRFVMSFFSERFHDYTDNVNEEDILRRLRDYSFRASFRLSGKTKYGILKKLNSRTAWLQLDDGRIIKRHISKHRVRFAA